jgi:hypothetical protein
MVVCDRGPAVSTVVLSPCRRAFQLCPREPGYHGLCPTAREGGPGAGSGTNAEKIFDHGEAGQGEDRGRTVPRQPVRFSAVAHRSLLACARHGREISSAHRGTLGAPYPLPQPPFRRRRRRAPIHEHGGRGRIQSVAARAVPVRPVDIRAKPHEPAPTIRPPPPRRVAKMDRSGSRSRAEQAPRRKVRREPVEPRENATGCAPAKTLPSGRQATTAQGFVGRIPKNRLVSLVRTIAAQGRGAVYQACRRNSESLARRISTDSSSQKPGPRPEPSTFIASRLKNRFRHMQLRTQARGAETKGDHVASDPTQTGRGWVLTKLGRAKATVKLSVSRGFEHGRWQAAVLSFARAVATKIALLLAKAAERWKQTRKRPTPR